MLSDYAAAGFDPEAFWALTPRLYLLHMQGRAEREDSESRRMVTGAWLTAMLFRSARLPRLARLLRDRPASGGDIDVRHRLASLRSGRPAMTMDEWRARHGR